MASHSLPPNKSLPRPRPPPPSAALNERELTILPLILLCTKDPTSLQFDWPKLAERLQMRNPRSAANSWLAVRKKIEAISSSSSSSSSLDPGSPSPKLTHNEQRFLANAISCTKQPLDVDYPALALKLGMKNPRSAANAWGSMRRKIEAGRGASALGDKASCKTPVNKSKLSGAAVRKSEQLTGKDGQLLMQSSVELPATITQPLSFKVVKCESEVSRIDEKRSMGPDFGKLDSDSGAYDMSIDQALNKRQIHLMALAVTDEAQEDRMRVKLEFFDEC